MTRTSGLGNVLADGTGLPGGRIGGSGGGGITRALLSVTLLTSGSYTANGSSVDTADVTVAVDDVLLLVIHTRRGETTGTAPQNPTGLATSWSFQGGSQYDASGSTRGRQDIYRAKVTSAGTGHVTMTWPSALGALNVTQYALVRVRGCLTTGTNAADAIVQMSGTTGVTGAANDTPAITLGTPFASSKNRPLVFVSTTATISIGEAGWSELRDQQVTNGTNKSGLAVVVNPTADQSFSSSLPVGEGNNGWRAEMIELAAA